MPRPARGRPEDDHGLRLLPWLATECPMRGKVKWYDPRKGYGFIAPITGGADIFVHASALEAAHLEILAEGQEIEYELIADHRGKKIAAHLNIIDNTELPS